MQLENSELLWDAAPVGGVWIKAVDEQHYAVRNPLSAHIN